MSRSVTPFLIIIGIPLLFLALIAAAQSSGLVASEQSSLEDSVDHASSSDSDILRLGNLNFHTSLETGLENANESGKMVFVYFRSESCGWCKKFEAESFKDIRIIKILNENFELVTLDTVKQREVATSLKVRGTPTEIFLRSNGLEIKEARISGYVDEDTFFTQLNNIVNT